MKLGGFEIEVIMEEYVRLDSRWHHENVCDPFTRLYYVKKGNGYLRWKENEIKLEPGKVYIVPAELNFEYGCNCGETLEKLFFHISVKTVECYDVLSRTKDIYSLDLEEVGCEDIFKLYEKEDYASMLKLKMMLYRTVCTFFEKYNFELLPYNKYSKTVENAMKYIRENVNISLNTDEIAKALFVSKSKLRNVFKEETGMTLGKYIDDMIFYCAKRFLINRKLTIGEISSELGFCDQFYFSRRFKEKYGKTPSEYRRETTT